MVGVGRELRLGGLEVRGLIEERGEGSGWQAAGVRLRASSNSGGLPQVGCPFFIFGLPQAGSQFSMKTPRAKGDELWLWGQNLASP